MQEEVESLSGKEHSPRNQKNSTRSKLDYSSLQRRLENKGVVWTPCPYEQTKGSVSKEEGKEWRLGRQQASHHTHESGDFAVCAC